MKSEGEFEVNFGYQCNSERDNTCLAGNRYDAKFRRTGSFSCLSGAALSANATLANTNICNGVIGAEILPSLDSPKSFRRVPSSPALSRLDMLSSSRQSSLSNLSCSPPTSCDIYEYDSGILKSLSAPARSEGFLNATEVQMAGGAAGEDRVQAVCSEENGWLFCAIYDGFNGRDAADFLACTLYDSIVCHFNLLDWQSKQDSAGTIQNITSNGPPHSTLDANDGTTGHCDPISVHMSSSPFDKIQTSSHSFQDRVLGSLCRALIQAENDFLYMVEQEMEERPDLVSVGSCVLVVLIHQKDLYTINLGDSRAVLATDGGGDDASGNGALKAIQLTDIHTVDDETEKLQLLSQHPDDPMTIVAGKIKGKLKVTRALGVGYLKKKNLNDALMGILRVRDLRSPPYVSTQPSLNVQRITNSDRFVIVASDGLFDFLSNEEAVEFVDSYILGNPSGDPAKFLLEKLMTRAADQAGFSMEELMSIPAGRRRKYHDDVTVMVIMLGSNQRTSKASTRI